MPLSDALARAAKPKDGKLTKFSDGYGLQLWAHPNGVRSWHVAYRFAGRQRSVTLGDYPELSLKDARERARDIRRRVAGGEDPSPRAPNQAPAPVAKTFGAIKADWLAKVEREGKAEATCQKAIWLAGLLGSLDSRPIAEIKAPEILEILKPIEAAGHLETVRRLRSTASRIFRFAAALGAVEHDPAALLHGAVAAPKADAAGRHGLRVVTSPMVALKIATIEALKADAALAALIGAKIYDEVPRDDRGDPSDASAPYLFLGAMRWGDFEIGCNPGLDVVVELHAVSTKFGREECWNIAEAIRHALEWRELTLAGGHLMTPYRRRSGGDAISPLFPKQAYVALRTQLSEALT